MYVCTYKYVLVQSQRRTSKSREIKEKKIYKPILRCIGLIVKNFLSCGFYNLATQPQSIFKLFTYH